MSQAELRKAAVVLMSLPRSSAERLVAELVPDGAAALRFEMAHGPAMIPAEQLAVVQEFVASIPVAVREVRPPAASAAVLAATSRPATRSPFAFLRESDLRGVSAALADEHPQTIALILAHLSSSHAAQILAELDDPLARDVTRRLAAIGAAGADAVDDVARGLERRLARRAWR
jgi:flagellar motor switch protein FliG